MMGTLVIKRLKNDKTRKRTSYHVEEDLKKDFIMSELFATIRNSHPEEFCK